jgi:hypothetical protein
MPQSRDPRTLVSQLRFDNSSAAWTRPSEWYQFVPEQCASLENVCEVGFNNISKLKGFGANIRQSRPPAPFFRHLIYLFSGVFFIPPIENLLQYPDHLALRLFIFSAPPFFKDRIFHRPSISASEASI